MAQTRYWLGGDGTVLWNKYKDKPALAHQDEPQFGAQSTLMSVYGTL